MDKVASIRASLGPTPPDVSPGRQPRIGLLVLDTRFERVPGDLGRADSWPVPAGVRVVAGADPARIVRPAGAADLAGVLPAFVDAALDLQAAGVQAIATSCGFLVLAQQDLQAALQVPVATSSLLQLPSLLARERQVGVLTIDAAALGTQHLLCAGVAAGRLADVLVEGVEPAGHFASAILRASEPLDPVRAAADLVAAARRLQARAPALRTLVLECTNMPPYRGAIESATGLHTRTLLDDPVVQALARRTMAA